MFLCTTDHSQQCLRYGGPGMRFEFKDGVPESAVKWLLENVPLHEWDIIREAISVSPPENWYCPAVYVYEERAALIFALTWLSEK